MRKVRTRKGATCFDGTRLLADVELDKTNTEISEMLRALELRKRAYYVNMPNLVYVIGMINRARSSACP